MAVAVLISIFTANTPVLAEPLTDQLKTQQKLLKQNQDTYNDYESQINSIESKVQIMDEKIMDMRGKIDEVNESIKKVKYEIGIQENEIKKSEEDLKKEQESFDKRVRAMYMSDSFGYINVLLESKSFSDLISRAQIISTVLNYDNTVMSELKSKKKQLNDKKLKLTEKHNDLAKLQDESEKKLEDLNLARSKQQELIGQLEEEQKLYASNMDGYQDRIDSILKQISASKQASASRSGASISRSGSALSSASGNSIVQYAVGFLGVPYVWGGDTSSGFDCSGFTTYVFSHFGVDLDRRAADQSRQGIPVSRDSLQPGDLVFFGSPAYHVGIYIGDGLYIHAPQTGDVVKISPVWWTNYSGARRVR